MSALDRISNPSFKDHFSGHAASYAEARPTYPDDLFRYLADLSPALDCAWDCATGNGQAACALSNYFDRIVATDASEEQIRAARVNDRVEYRVAPAEASGLPSESVGLITVAQAMHWFDIEKFFEEAQRVLRPGGVLAFWCYGHCSVAPEVDGLLHDIYASVDDYWPPERDIVENEYRGIVSPLAEIEGPSYSMKIEWTVQQMLAYLRTWSASQAALRTTGNDPLAEFAMELEQQWGDQSRTVIWPITLRVGRKS